MTETGSIVLQILSVISVLLLLILEFCEKVLDKRNLISLKLAALVVIFLFVSNV